LRYRVVFGGVFAVAAIVVYSIVTLREKQQQMNNMNSSKNAATGAEMDVLLDEVEVGIEPATISPKMSNYSSKIKRGF
jgi:phosphatidylserine decarboxylase